MLSRSKAAQQATHSMTIENVPCTLILPAIRK